MTAPHPFRPERMVRARRFTSRPSARVTAAALAAFLAPAGADAAPASTLNDLRLALIACAKRAAPPPSTAGSVLWMVASIRRDGTGFGAPRVYDSRLVGEPADQQAFVQGALAGLAACFPVPVADDLGAAIAGRLIRIRVVSRSRGVLIPAPTVRP